MQTAAIISQDPYIEEELWLRLGENQLKVFSEICPYPLEVGQSYPVELTAVTLDEPNVAFTPDAADQLHPIGGYRYRLSGTYSAGKLHVFEMSVDVSDLVDDAVADGTRLTLEAERISAAFE